MALATVTFQMSRTDRDRFEQACKKEGAYKSYKIRQLIYEYLERQKVAN